MCTCVLQEKSDVEPELPTGLSDARAQLVSLACELARLQAAAGLPVSEEEYLKEVLHPGLMQVSGQDCAQLMSPCNTGVAVLHVCAVQYMRMGQGECSRRVVSYLFSTEGTGRAVDLAVMHVCTHLLCAPRPGPVCSLPWTAFKSLR